MCTVNEIAVFFSTLTKLFCYGIYKVESKPINRKQISTPIFSKQSMKYLPYSCITLHQNK